MDPFTAILLASQLYMSVPHAAAPEHWPTLEVTISESSQIFPDACNRSGTTSWSRYIGIGNVACANTNLLTRMCHVTYSTNPLATVFVVGLPFANKMLLNHELEHCRGGDHPVPGTLSLAEATKLWHDLGQPYATPAEWAEIEAVAERAGGFGAAEVQAEIERQMPNWVEASKRYATELALKERDKATTSAAGASESAEVAAPLAEEAAWPNAGDMPTVIVQAPPISVEAGIQDDAVEHASAETENSGSVDVGPRGRTGIAAMAELEWQERLRSDESSQKQ